MSAAARRKFAALLTAALPLCAYAGEDAVPFEVPAAVHVPNFLPEPAYVTAEPAVRDISRGAYAVPAEASKYNAYVERAAREFDVDPALIHAIIRVESALQPAAVSPKGAIGLMQVMPQTAERFGKVNLFDPEQNIRTGTRYLRTLIQLFRDQLDLVLAAYNAGEQVVARLGRIPPYPETQAYVAAVTKLYERYRAAGVQANR